MDRLRLGERLIKAGVITEELLQDALREQRERRAAGRPSDETLIGFILVQLGYATDDQVFQYLVDDGIKVS